MSTQNASSGQIKFRDFTSNSGRASSVCWDSRRSRVAAVFALVGVALLSGQTVLAQDQADGGATASTQPIVNEALALSEKIREQRVPLLQRLMTADYCGPRGASTSASASESGAGEGADRPTLLGKRPSAVGCRTLAAADLLEQLAVAYQTDAQAQRTIAGNLRAQLTDLAEVTDAQRAADREEIATLKAELIAQREALEVERARLAALAQNYRRLDSAYLTLTEKLRVNANLVRSTYGTD